jgi:uncharacterized membrane protein
MESWNHLWLRVISWRIVTTIVSFIILFFMTGELAISTLFTFVNAVIQTVFHVIHEKIWNKFPGD